MTANAFEEDRKRALEVGMDGYIAKPIHMESVLDALQEGLAGLLFRGKLVTKEPMV
mgnify:CR=1 FL=1